MNLVQNFEALVRGEFAFLERDLGFLYEGTEVHLPEVWATFRGDEATVVVTFEVGAAPWVVIEFASPSPEAQSPTVRASLSALLEVATGSTQLPDRPVERVDDPLLREMLHENASALQQYGVPLLRGDRNIQIQVAEKQREIAVRLRNGSKSPPR